MPKDFSTLSAEITDPSIKRTLEKEADLRRADLAIRSLDSELDEAMQARKLLPEVLGQLKTLEAALARPLTLSATLKQPAKPKTGRRFDLSMVPIVAGLAELKRYASQTPIATTVREAFPGDHEQIARIFSQKSATGTAETTDPLTGANLVSTAVGAWVKALQPVSVFGSMASGGTMLPMAGHRSITFPHRPETSRGDLAKNWVPQSGEIPVKETVFGSNTFNLYKCAVISVVTEELIATATPELLPLLRQLILDDSAQMFDSLLLDPSLDAVAGTRPGSPWFGSTTQTSLGDAFQDFAWLAARLTEVQGTRRPAIVMSQARHLRLWMARDENGWIWREDLTRGDIAGIELIVSGNVPDDKLYGIDLANFAYWAPPPVVDASQTTTVHMSPDGDATAPTRSMMQINSVALRMVQPATWGLLRQDSTTCYLSAVTW